MDTIRICAEKKPKMIAHRGLSGIETENSLAAFVAAGNRDYYGVETDVHVTKDGRFVIFHDDETGRLCEENLSVESSDFSSLRALKMKEMGGAFSDVQKIPTLAEYLRVMKRYEKNCIIELKNPMAEKHIEEIVCECRREYDLERIVFISFSYENLVCLRKLLPRQRLQFLTGTCAPDLTEKLRRYSLDLDIEYNAVTKELVAEMHANGIIVNCWTCDDEKTAMRLIDCGVDMITTNRLQ